jgi:hypothetical protein
MEGRNTDVFELWFWERRILTFEYDYVALPGLRAEDYARHPNPLAAAWSTLMNMERDRRALAAVEAMEVVDASPLDVERKHLLLDFIQSYAPLEDDQKRDLNELLTDPKRERTLTMRKLWSQEVREKAMEEGIEKGEREFFLRLCLKKFDQLPPDELRRKLERMNLSQIDELGTKLLTANSHEELGLAD